MKEDTYNGWTNRETWAVALWIGNDSNLDCEMIDAVAQALTDYHSYLNDGGLGSAGCRYSVGEAIEERFERYIFDLVDNDQAEDVRNILSDVGSLWRVDWAEIADHDEQVIDFMEKDFPEFVTPGVYKDFLSRYQADGTPRDCVVAQ